MGKAGFEALVTRFPSLYIAGAFLTWVGTRYFKFINKSSAAKKASQSKFHGYGKSSENMI